MSDKAMGIAGMVVLAIAAVYLDNGLLGALCVALALAVLG